MWQRLWIAWACVVALVFAGGTASAASGAPAKPHQGTSEFSAALNICAFALARVESHSGNTAFSTALASDVPDAARGGGEASKVLLRTGQQLQAKFKHAKDFGVPGNYNKANASEFSRAIHLHINSPGVRAIEGTYHKQPVTHFLDPSSGLNVMADPAGNFISGWRLSAGQLQNVLTHGGL